MHDFHRYVLSIFVNMHNTDSAKFTGYPEILGLLTEHYQRANMPVSPDDVYGAVKYLIDIGFLEVSESSYRLSPTGKMYWDYNLTDSTNLAGELRQVKGRANAALVVSLLGLAWLIFQYLR